jgi:hypothetical protein
VPQREVGATPAERVGGDAELFLEAVDLRPKVAQMIAELEVSQLLERHMRSLAN